MVVEYMNRKCQKYYLHQGATKTGKPKYFFSMKNEGTLVKTIPDGYEIYENPNSQVFLQKIQPKLISDEEVAIVDRGMKEFCSLNYYKIDVKKDTIFIYTANQDEKSLVESLSGSRLTKEADIQKAINNTITYSTMLKFTLIDEERRTFITHRFCFLGSIDDWIDIGCPDTLQNLVQKYVKHLGHNSFYELH
jgi:hypothetical protein